MTQEVFTKRAYWLNYSELEDRLYLEGSIQSIKVDESDDNTRLYIVTHESEKRSSRKEKALEDEP